MLGLLFGRFWIATIVLVGTGCSESHACERIPGCTPGTLDLVVLERPPEGATGVARLREVDRSGSRELVSLTLLADERAIAYEQGPNDGVGLLVASGPSASSQHLVELSSGERLDVSAEVTQVAPTCDDEPTGAIPRLFFDPDGRGGYLACGTDGSRAVLHVDLDSPTRRFDGAVTLGLTAHDGRALVRVCEDSACDTLAWHWVSPSVEGSTPLAALDSFDSPVAWDAEDRVWVLPYFAPESDSANLEWIDMETGSRRSGPEVAWGTYPISVSPDGSKLVTVLALNRDNSMVGEIRDLTIWDTETWSAQEVELDVDCSGPFTTPWQSPRVSWSPDADAVTFGCPAQNWIIELDSTPTLRALAPAHLTEWTRDGSALLLHTSEGWTWVERATGLALPPSWDEGAAQSVALRRSQRRRQCGRWSC